MHLVWDIKQTLHDHFGVNHAINDLKMSQTNFGGKGILLVVSKKKKSSNLKNCYFVGFDLKVDLICHVMLVSNLSLGFVSYFFKLIIYFIFFFGNGKEGKI